MTEHKRIAQEFAIEGNILEIKPLGNGLINDTFLVCTDGADDYVLQRINNAIFKDVELLQHNIDCATAHIRSKGGMTLRFLPCKATGKSYWTDGETYWLSLDEEKLTEYAETSPLNHIEEGDGTKDFGIITSSTSYQYVKEAFGDSVSVLKLGMINPLPVKLIKDFAAKVGKVYVIEELDPIVETHCKNIGVEVIGKDKFSILGEFSQKSIEQAFDMADKTVFSLDTDIPVRPPMMCSGCPHRGMYYVLAKNKITVLGDIGCYTLGAAPPLNALDMTLCMGASVSGIHGYNKAGGEETEGKTVCVIGDSTFMHSGVTGLINIAYNQSNSTVIILDNSITGMTGHQQNPTTGYSIKGDPAGKVNLEDLCHSIGINSVRVVDPYDLEDCEKVVKEELAKNEPSVIISRRPCVLLKYVKPKKPLWVNPEKCRGCKKCMKFGCPSISFRDGHAVVDPTLCVGCGVCAQLCAFDAFESEVPSHD